MLQFPEIDPVLLHLGPLHVRWYGLMYVLGFIASFFLVKQQLKRFNFNELHEHFGFIRLMSTLGNVNDKAGV